MNAFTQAGFGTGRSFCLVSIIAHFGTHFALALSTTPSTGTLSGVLKHPGTRGTASKPH